MSNRGSFIMFCHDNYIKVKDAKSMWYLVFEIPNTISPNVFGKVFKCPETNKYLVFYLNTRFLVDPTLEIGSEHKYPPLVGCACKHSAYLQIMFRRPHFNLSHFRLLPYTCVTSLSNCEISLQIKPNVDVSLTLETATVRVNF